MSSVILYEDIIKNATALTATTSASGYDRLNMQNDNKLSTWRSTAITVQTLTATFTAANINTIALAAHNLIAGSILRFRIYTLSGDVSAVYDSGNLTLTDVLPPPDGFDTNNSLSFGFGGGNYFVNLSGTYSAEKIIVSVTSAANPDGFIEISRLLAGEAIITTNVLYDATVGYFDTSSRTRSDAGQIVIDRMPKAKNLSFSISNMDDDERIGVNKMLRKNGGNVPVFVSIFPVATDKKAREFEIYGYIDDTQLRYFSHNLTRADLRIEEF